MLSLLLLGFLIGMRHALEADHVAAVASLSTHSTSVKQAVKLGSIWGVGHTLTLFMFGSVVLLTDLFIPQTMANVLELCVGIMLILLGLDVLRRLFKDRVHYHIHRHFQGPTNNSEQRHFHAHSHANDVAGKASQCSRGEHVLHHDHDHVGALSYRALFIGVLHGMAGSAALILLTIETINSPLQGILYITLFGIGSVAGMAALSYIISIPLRASATGLTWMHNSLQLMIGTATIVLGGFVTFEHSHGLF